jgi:hypothetical protein
MNASEILMAVLKDLAVQIPSIIAIIACLILAIVRWKRHPRASLLMVIGLVLLLIHEFAFAVVYASVPDLIIKSANELERATVSRNLNIVLAVTYNCLEVVPFVVFLIAIFMGRRKTENAAV